MNKKKNLNILNFPANIVEAERQVEAILFAAEEPLDIESIQARLKNKANITNMYQIRCPKLHSSYQIVALTKTLPNNMTIIKLRLYVCFR